MLARKLLPMLARKLLPVLERKPPAPAWEPLRVAARRLLRASAWGLLPMLARELLPASARKSPASAWGATPRTLWALAACLATVAPIASALSASAPSASAAECPAPDSFAVGSATLPATAAAVHRGDLTIVALGGTATLGGPAHGVEFTWPARLGVYLGQRLPGVGVRVLVRAAARQSSADLLTRLDTQMAADKPALVIWGPGASAAGRGDDLDTFSGDLTDAIGKIRGHGADLVLMTLQYAPSVARVINLPPYRAAVLRAAEMADLPVFDRYDLMRFWSDNAFLDLDATDAAERTRVARKVYDCMADLLARGIADAVK